MFSTSAIADRGIDAVRERVLAFPHHPYGGPPDYIGAHAPFPVHTLRREQLYRLREGCLVLFHRLDSERRQILDILGPGRLLERAVADRLQCEAMALAPTRLEPIEDRPVVVKRLAAENRDVLLARALGHLSRLGKQRASERVAAALLDLHQQFAAPTQDEPGDGASFPLYLSRADLADWLGLTLETVSRCMSRFRRDGLIGFGADSLLVVRDSRALQEIARGERVVASIYTPQPKG